MITVLSTNGLYEQEYNKIIDEINEINTKFAGHRFKLSNLGTGNLSYSILDCLLSPLKNTKIKKIANSILGRFMTYLIKRKKILVSYANMVWTTDGILKGTLIYPVRRVEYPWAILNSKMEKPMKILDVGSGLTLLPIYLASKGHQVTSIDTDKIVMERVTPQISEYAGNMVSYRTGDVTHLDFKDNSFDRVFCISVLEHLEEESVNGKIVNYRKKNFDVKAIGEMLRVLKPGGFLVLTFDWDENPENNRTYRLDDIYERVLKNYKKSLLVDKKPIINWEDLRKKHMESWKAFPPYTYVEYSSWAVGVILQK